MNDTPKPSDERGMTARIEQAIARLQRTRRGSSPGRHRVMLGIAFVVFCVAGYFAYDSFPEDESVSWLPILVAGFVGTPLAVVLNGVEYRTSASMLGHRISLVEALRVTVIGTAANLLPVPGSVIVRVRALSGMGSSYAHALHASAAVGVLFVGTTVLLAGVAQLATSVYLLGGVWAASGVAALIAGHLLVRRRAGQRAPRLTLRIVVIESAFVLTSALRLFLILHGLSYEPGFSDAVALTVAGVLATATGFFPAGLGLRELLVAGISPLVGLSAAAGLSAAVVDRLFGFVAAAAITAVVWLTNTPRDATDEPGTEPNARTQPSLADESTDIAD